MRMMFTSHVEDVRAGGSLHEEIVIFDDVY